MKLSLFGYTIDISRPRTYKYAETKCDFTFTLPAKEYVIPHKHVREVLRHWVKKWQRSTPHLYDDSVIIIETRTGSRHLEYNELSQYLRKSEYDSNGVSQYGVFSAIYLIKSVHVHSVMSKSFLPQSPFIDSVSDMHVITRAEWVHAIDSGKSEQESTDNVNALFEKFMTYL